MGGGQWLSIERSSLRDDRRSRLWTLHGGKLHRPLPAPRDAAQGGVGGGDAPLALRPGRSWRPELTARDRSGPRPLGGSRGLLLGCLPGALTEVLRYEGGGGAQWQCLRVGFAGIDDLLEDGGADVHRGLRRQIRVDVRRRLDDSGGAGLERRLLERPMQVGVRLATPALLSLTCVRLRGAALSGRGAAWGTPRRRRLARDARARCGLLLMGVERSGTAAGLGAIEIVVALKVGREIESAVHTATVVRIVGATAAYADAAGTVGGISHRLQSINRVKGDASEGATRSISSFSRRPRAHARDHRPAARWPEHSARCLSDSQRTAHESAAHRCWTACT